MLTVILNTNSGLPGDSCGFNKGYVNVFTYTLKSAKRIKVNVISNKMFLRQRDLARAALDPVHPHNWLTTHGYFRDLR